MFILERAGRGVPAPRPTIVPGSNPATGWGRIPLFVLLTLVLPGGCAAPLATSPGPETPPRATATVEVHAERDPPPPAARRTVIGHSVEGRPIEVVVLGPGPVDVLVMASIHGDESAGTPLLARLEDELRRDPRRLRGRRVHLIAQANPDGLASGRRGNARGIDLNRNFPAPNWRASTRYGATPLSEPEAGALAAYFTRIRPDRVITIHQPLGCIDHDGPARELAESMAAECDLPVRKLGTRPGSLGAYLGEELRVPTITVELPASATTMAPATRWTRYGPMLLAGIEYEG